MAISDQNSNAIVQNTSGIAPQTSLSAVSAVGAGTALDGAVVRANAVITVTTSAGVTAGAVALQGSLDGVNFVNLGSAISTTAASTTYTAVATNVFMRYVRAAVTTAITGGTVSASVGVSG
jgi:hypothetical protein